jgi:PAS domain S-box-containing protein
LNVSRKTTTAGGTSAPGDELFRLLVKSVKDYAIFLLDPTGHVASWNEGAERIKGYKESEIVGQHFSKFYPRAAVESGWPDYELQVAEKEGRFEDEGWRVRKDGSMFWANVVITAVRDESGVLRGFAKVTRDLTERRYAEEALRQSEERYRELVDELEATNRTLEEKNAEVESFVYGVSHDVRGPLANLQGFNLEIQRTAGELMKLIESDGSMAPEIRERARTILGRDMAESAGFLSAAVTHLAGIVDSLLRLSRLGRVAYEYREVDVAEVMGRVLGSMQGTIVPKKAEIVVGNLPRLWSDASALEQIFSNLIGNALKYSDPARRCRIEIGGATEGACGPARYYVKDNGLGIPPTAIKELFTAFRRFHPASGPGEGIGLAMVRRIVERLDGTVRVESKIGEGSTFFLEFPNPNRQA